MCGGDAPNHHGHPLQVKMDLQAFSCSVAGRVERGDEGVHAFKVEYFVDDITACMEHRNKELAGIAEVVVQLIEREVEERRI